MCKIFANPKSNITKSESENPIEELTQYFMLISKNKTILSPEDTIDDNILRKVGEINTILDTHIINSNSTVKNIKSQFFNKFKLINNELTQNQQRIRDITTNASNTMAEISNNQIELMELVKQNS